MLYSAYNPFSNICNARISPSASIFPKQRNVCTLHLEIGIIYHHCIAVEFVLLHSSSCINTRLTTVSGLWALCVLCTTSLPCYAYRLHAVLIIRLPAERHCSLVRSFGNTAYACFADHLLGKLDNPHCLLALLTMVLPSCVTFACVPLRCNTLPSRLILDGYNRYTCLP